MLLRSGLLQGLIYVATPRFVFVDEMRGRLRKMQNLMIKLSTYWVFRITAIFYTMGAMAYIFLGTHEDNVKVVLEFGWSISITVPNS